MFPPTQPKGLNPLEGFISVIHSPCIFPDVPPPPNLKGWIPLKGLSVLIIPPVRYPDVPPPTQPKGLKSPFKSFLVLIIPPVWYPDVPPPTQPKRVESPWRVYQCWSICLYCTLMFPPPNLKGWIPLRGLSVLIILPVWYPDGSPPTQPKGLNPLEGFISVDLSALMVPPHPT